MAYEDRRREFPRQSVRLRIPGPGKNWMIPGSMNFGAKAPLKVGERRGNPLEMLKMKIDPTMCMKTQAMMTKCQVIEPVFCTKMLPLRQIRQQMVGHPGLNCKIT